MKKCCDCGEIPLECFFDSEEKAVVWCSPRHGGCGRLTKAGNKEAAKKRWEDNKTDDFQ